MQVRPFYWKREGPHGETKVNVLGPLLRWREDDVFERLQIFPNVFYTARKRPQELRSWWLVVFPFLFLGHDDFLVFPVGGVSHGILGLDELLLVTPLYARSKRRSSHPTDPVVYTIHHVLFPLIAWGSDGRPGGRRKFRVAPFYGRSRGRDGEMRGFVLWPFWTWRRKSEDDRGFFLFPFYGKDRTPTREDTTILFPFYHRSENFLTGATDTALWPFWRRAGGADGLEVRRYWPLFEYRRAGFTTTEYVAWPFWRQTHVSTGRQFAKYTWVVPFYRRVRTFDRATGEHGRKTVVWPIGRWETMPDGTREVAIPVLSPFDGQSIREFSEPIRPLISLYHRRVSADGRREASALFGLVMTRRTPETKKVRILGGLVGWDRGPDGRFLRLLWGLSFRTGDPR